MTIQELLHIFAFDVQDGMSDDQIGEQAEHLAKKIEELVMKERDTEILTFINSGRSEPSTDSGWSIDLNDVENFIQKIYAK